MMESREGANITQNNNEFSDMLSSKFHITILNGKLSVNLSKLPKGIRVVEYSSLSANEKSCYLNSLIPRKKKTNNNDPNQINIGVFLEFNSHIKSSDNLYINHINTAENPEASQTENWFILKKGVQINIIEKKFHSKTLKIPVKKSLFSNWVLEENSKLIYYSFGAKNINKESFITNNIRIKQQRKSTLSFLTFYWGPGMINNCLEVFLEGPKAICNTFSISLLKNDSSVDNNITIRHNAPECESSQVYKGVYDGESRGVFNSLVFVEKDAQKTSAVQQNNNILLSDYASVNSNPQLEIFADDVKCAHGSTIGQIDPRALFYLRSRGMSENLANRMLLQGFLSDVVEAIQDADIKETVLLTLAEKL